MSMKALILLIAASTSMAAWADGKPDTLAILKHAKFTSTREMKDLSTGAITYRIEFCSDEVCDRFEGAGDKLRMLSDYAYLFAVYAGTYDTYTAPRSVVFNNKKDLQAPNPMVTDAKEKGYAQAVLDAYRDQYHCPQDKEERKCVMHALFKVAGVRRYSVRYDEGESYSPVDEDEKPVYQPPP